MVKVCMAPRGKHELPGNGDQDSTAAGSAASSQDEAQTNEPGKQILQRYYNVDDDTIDEVLLAQPTPPVAPRISAEVKKEEDVEKLSTMTDLILDPLEFQNVSGFTVKEEEKNEDDKRIGFRAMGFCFNKFE